jgi:NAD(P)-dependent dehydrogenase (short-subunit alcohol dehydrogenase family)
LHRLFVYLRLRPIGLIQARSTLQIRQLFETNVIGMVATSRAALPLMHRNGQGRIINISSVLAARSDQQAAALCAESLALFQAIGD